MTYGRAAEPHSDDIVVVAGAGGFIGGHLVKYLQSRFYNNIVAVDKKPVNEWYQVSDTAKNVCLDLSEREHCEAVCIGASEVYNLAADMGGMGFIENFRVDCMRSVLINTHLTEAAYRQGVGRYFYASSACVYNTMLQDETAITALREEAAYPAQCERGYGWEKLYGEMLCQEYTAEKKLQTHIARFHNVYGPHGTWDGGREKAPAAMCRKVIEAIDNRTYDVEIWGDGEQTRSFMYITDCVIGIDKIMHSDKLIAEPINLGSDELVSINKLAKIAESFHEKHASLGVGLHTANEYGFYHNHKLDAPLGVRGRNSDNTMIKEKLGWAPEVPLAFGMRHTYNWIMEEYYKRKVGK